METECIPDIFGFEAVEGRDVVAAFDGGAVSPLACDTSTGNASRDCPPSRRIAAPPDWRQTAPMSARRR
jgi:hypothetical protein